MYLRRFAKTVRTRKASVWGKLIQNVFLAKPMPKIFCFES